MTLPALKGIWPFARQFIVLPSLNPAILCSFEDSPWNSSAKRVLGYSTRLRIKITTVFLLLFLLLFASCSSVPKRPAEIFAVLSMTETQLGLANKEADQGNYTEALNLLSEAWRLAVLSDRPQLRIRVNLSRGNVLYALGRITEAEKIWKEAEAEALFAQEPSLAAASRAYRLRSQLLAGSIDPQEARALIMAEQDALKSDKLLSAVGWTVRGLAEKELGLYEEAERSVGNALSIHEKERYLEQAAYDWYLIASIRSVNGDYAAAIAALNQAINFDRRAENSFGLAMDWAAMGNVFLKMGNEDPAVISWRRAADILRAMDKTAQAKEIESRIKTDRQSPEINKSR
jgi:tetratricopeptide (TPR) repeat protein